MQSPDNTLIGSGQSITDALGNVWTISASGQVAVNGIVDATTANVTHLAYADGIVWQENTEDLWWSKTSPNAAWSPPDGTATVPVPIAATQYETVIGVAAAGGLIGSITDTSGNSWEILNGQIAVNGVIDTTTANVIELAYVNGQIWQENSQGLWWSKTAPAAAWEPPLGTAVNPVTGTFYSGNDAGNAAVINIGELTASPNGGSGMAPQSTSEIITPGVNATGTNITVSTETATLVVNGNSTLTAGATLNLIGAYRTPTEISGPLENNGVMTVRASTLEVGALSGSGSVEASAGSSLTIQSSGTGNTIALRSSYLVIGGQGGGFGQPGVPGGLTFLAPVTMDRESSITLPDTPATTESLLRSGGSISEVFLYNGNTQVADLKVSGVSNLYALESGSGATATIVLSTTHVSGDLPIVSHST